MFAEKEEAYYAIILFSLFAFILTVIIVVTAVLYYNRRKRFLQEKNKMELQFQHTLLQAQMEIQEQTFRTISQEIHDNIGQMLSLAKMNLSKFEIDRQHSDEAVLNAKDLVSKAVVSLRDLSKSLNTDTITAIGLMRSIELELELVEKTAGITTQMNINGTAKGLAPQHELIIFRIVQEALHNSIRHAAPSVLRVDAAFDQQHLKLSIADNGTGFDAQDTDTAGSGLRNMQSRSKLIGATWHLSSTKNTGTCIQLTVPINN